MSSSRILRTAIAGVIAVGALISATGVSSPMAALGSLNGDAAASSVAHKNDKPGKNATVTVYLTRHGETWLNATQRMQGWSDAPLTEEGTVVAEHLGKGLAEAGVKFKSAYSADMLRHFSTASTVLEELGYKGEAVRDERLREIAFGRFEGATQAEVFAAAGPYVVGDPRNPLNLFAAIIPANDAANAAAKAKDPNAPALIAESFEQVGARSMAALNEIAAAQAKKGGGNVLVVSSGITIMADLTAMGADLSGITTGIGNASVSKLEYKNGTWTVLSVNDLSYVEAGSD